MKAEQIILGKIVTLDTDRPVAEAIVVCNGLIAYIGSREVAMKMKDESTEILDYGENVVYPGVHGCAYPWPDGRSAHCL